MPRGEGAARCAPLPFHGCRRDVEDGRCLVDAQAGEEAQLHDLPGARVHRGQAAERFVERDDVEAFVGRDPGDRLVERDADLVPAAFCGAPRERVIHEDAAHHLRREPEETGAIRRRNVLRGETHVRFVNERGRTQRVSFTLVPQKALQVCADWIARKLQ